MWIINCSLSQRLKSFAICKYQVDLISEKRNDWYSVIKQLGTDINSITQTRIGATLIRWSSKSVANDKIMFVGSIKSQNEHCEINYSKVCDKKWYF